MHSLIASTTTPSITVGIDEVPLTVYFKALELYSSGQNADSILQRLSRVEYIYEIKDLHGIVHSIIFNQQLISQTSQPSNSLAPSPAISARDECRNSCIIDVAELDDLDVAQMVAKKKAKQQAGLKHFSAMLK